MSGTARHYVADRLPKGLDAHKSRACILGCASPPTPAECMVFHRPTMGRVGAAEQLHRFPAVVMGRICQRLDRSAMHAWGRKDHGILASKWARREQPRSAT